MKNALTRIKEFFKNTWTIIKSIFAKNSLTKKENKKIMKWKENFSKFSIKGNIARVLSGTIGLKGFAV